MSKMVIYSCVTGGYDKLHAGILDSQVIQEPGVDYVLFTDDVESATRFQRKHSVTWDIRELRQQHPLCRRRTARWHKLNSHILFPDHTHSIWVDGSQRIKKTQLCSELVGKFLFDKDVSAFKHPDRTCLYQELRACIKLKKDNALLMERQIQKYRDEGYPPFNGLVETACVIRRHNHRVTEFNTLWWQQLEQNSLRDQLSFNYVAWKLGVDYGRIPGCRAKSPYFDFVPHGRG